MIPEFNHSGVLPPFHGAAHEFASRSPYFTDMTAVASRFTNTHERRTIFEGLLAYRKDLRAFGIEVGFQWLDGSFVEDVERVRSRPPADVDIVTFGFRPAHLKDDSDWATAVASAPELFSPHAAKLKYRCDAYFVDLSTDGSWLVDQTTYWNSLFSHQRDTSLWKGILRVPLEDDSTLAEQFPVPAND
ncbi:DUF6932 family protein [Luteibacter sp.]|uniref:DUF6932 family protein n=1 Tax=Luteibacter sp. TaxID=1886636 RepID=UPI003F8168F4